MSLQSVEKIKGFSSYDFGANFEPKNHYSNQKWPHSCHVCTFLYIKSYFSSLKSRPHSVSACA